MMASAIDEDDGWHPSLGPPPPETSDHPDVMRLHETLDAIEREAIPKIHLADTIDSARERGRTERKRLEREAASLFPKAGIDPEDTGEILIDRDRLVT